MRCHAETPGSAFFSSVLSLVLSILSVAGCLLLHLPHSLSVQKPGYKIWTFLLQPGVRIASPRICPICCVPFPFRCAFKYLDTKSDTSHSFRVQKPGYKIWTLFLTCLSSSALPSGPSSFFFPLRSIRFLRLSPNLHSCSLTSSVLVSDLKLGESLVQ